MRQEECASDEKRAARTVTNVEGGIECDQHGLTIRSQRCARTETPGACCRLRTSQPLARDQGSQLVIAKQRRAITVPEGDDKRTIRHGSNVDRSASDCCRTDGANALLSLQ